MVIATRTSDTVRLLTRRRRIRSCVEPPAGAVRRRGGQGLRLPLPGPATRGSFAADGVWLVSAMTLAARSTRSTAVRFRPARLPPNSVSLWLRQCCPTADREIARRVTVSDLLSRGVVSS